MQPRRDKISAVVITLNRGEQLTACLRALRFTDEVIVVDKVGRGGAAFATYEYVDDVLTEPKSQSKEASRALATSHCSYDWIVCLDGDECLSHEAVRFIESEIAAPRADAYALPVRHHDPGGLARDWIEHRICCFRRGTVAFTASVPGGIEIDARRVMRVAADAGACVHLLPDAAVANWIGRTNRRSDLKLVWCQPLRIASPPPWQRAET